MSYIVVKKFLRKNSGLFDDVMFGDIIAKFFFVTEDTLGVCRFKGTEGIARKGNVGVLRKALSFRSRKSPL